MSISKYLSKVNTFPIVETLNSGRGFFKTGSKFINKLTLMKLLSKLCSINIFSFFLLFVSYLS